MKEVGGMKEKQQQKTKQKNTPTWLWVEWHHFKAFILKYKPIYSWHEIGLLETNKVA